MNEYYEHPHSLLARLAARPPCCLPVRPPARPCACPLARPVTFPAALSAPGPFAHPAGCLAAWPASCIPNHPPAHLPYMVSCPSANLLAKPNSHRGRVEYTYIANTHTYMCAHVPVCQSWSWTALLQHGDPICDLPVQVHGSYPSWRATWRLLQAHKLLASPLLSPR